MIDFVTREVEVECLPTEIPDKLVLDVSELHVGQHAEAGDLTLPEGVVLAEDPHRVIAAVSVMKVEEEVPAEGALVEAEKAEPEVIGRGKAEEGEEEGEEE
jgi:large subunit ribosomal protein L25